MKNGRYSHERIKKVIRHLRRLDDRVEFDTFGVSIYEQEQRLHEALRDLTLIDEELEALYGETLGRWVRAGENIDKVEGVEGRKGFRLR